MSDIVDSAHTIQFKNLNIWRDYYGNITGKITINSNDGSEVVVTIPSSAMEPIVDLVASQLAEATSIQINRLKEAILNRNSIK